MSQWLERNRGAIEDVLDDDERLVDADRVIASRRRSVRHVPRVGFVLAVTDRRLVALKASPLLARPQHVLASWTYDEGAALSPARLGRVQLVLPDRYVVTLRPFGPRSVTHLARR